MSPEHNSQSDEIKGPDPDSIYGEEIPSHEEVQEEISRYKSTPAPPPKPPESPKPPPEKSEEKEAIKDRSTLIAALRQVAEEGHIANILEQLSPEERELLQLRFDISEGERLMSQRQAAERLGLNFKDYWKREQELLEQIYSLADLDQPEP